MLEITLAILALNEWKMLPDYIRFFSFLLAHWIPAFEHKIKGDINQQNFKIVVLHFVKPE